MYHDWDLVESSLAYDYQVVPTRAWLQGVHKDQFLNLVRHFSGDSPAGRVATILETPDKMLTAKQRDQKNQWVMWRAGVRGFS